PVANRRQNVAAADLVPEEMRRTRYHDRIGWIFCHPIDAREMKAADAAGLVTSGAADVVEPALKTCDRTDVLQIETARRRLLQRADNVIPGEYGISALGLYEAEGRLQFGWLKADR